MEEEKVFTFYRLEFHKDNCKNQSKVSISGKNNIKFKNYQLFLSDFEHHKYFSIKKSSKVSGAKYSKIKITVPVWVKELIDTVAINQVSAKNKEDLLREYSEYLQMTGIELDTLISIKKRRPMLVDEKCPGQAYQLPKNGEN